MVIFLLYKKFRWNFLRLFGGNNLHFSLVCAWFSACNWNIFWHRFSGTVLALRCFIWTLLLDMIGNNRSNCWARYPRWKSRSLALKNGFFCQKCKKSHSYKTFSFLILWARKVRLVFKKWKARSHFSLTRSFFLTRTTVLW